MKEFVLSYVILLSGHINKSILILYVIFNVEYEYDMHFNQRPLILEIQEKPLQLPQKFLYLWRIHDKLENPEGEERALQNTSFKLINGYCFSKTKTVKINCGVSMVISVSSFDVLINCIIRYRNLNPLWS